MDFPVDPQGQLLTLCDTRHGTVSRPSLHYKSGVFAVNLLPSLPLYFAGKVADFAAFLACQSR